MLQSASAQQTAADSTAVLAGRWEFNTVGTWAKSGFGNTAESFTQKFVLVYNAETKQFEGAPFGWRLIETRVRSAVPGGRVRFETAYSKQYSIEWSGNLSADGETISDGRWEHRVGRGTFTARKLTEPEAPAPRRRNPTGPAVPLP